MTTKPDAPPFATFAPAVFLLITSGLVATDLYLPSLPAIQTSFHTTASLVKLTLSLYLLTYGLSQIFYGPLSDRFGRRKIALSGLLFSLVGSLVCILSFGISSLIVGRILQGLGLGAGAAIARPAMRDVYTGNDLAHFTSYLTVGYSILMALAPTVGGYLETYVGWRMNFLAILLFTVFSMVWCWFWLPETNKQFNKASTQISTLLKNYFHLLKSPIFLGYAGCSSLAFGGLTAYLGASPFLFQKVIGLSPVQYGWLALVLAGGMGGGGYCNGLLVKRHGRHRVLVVGICIAFLSGVIMLIPGLFGYLSTFVVMLPMFLYSLGLGMIFGNALAGAFHPFAHIAGFAGGLYGCIQIIGGAIGTGIVALINEETQIPLSIILIAVGLITYILQLIAFYSAVRSGHS